VIQPTCLDEKIEALSRFVTYTRVVLEVRDGTEKLWGLVVRFRVEWSEIEENEEKKSLSLHFFPLHWKLSGITRLDCLKDCNGRSLFNPCVISLTFSIFFATLCQTTYRIKHTFSSPPPRLVPRLLPQSLSSRPLLDKSQYSPSILIQFNSFSTPSTPQHSTSPITPNQPREPNRSNNRTHRDCPNTDEVRFSWQDWVFISWCIVSYL